jgi:sulfite exporter TauE/SafE
VSRRPRPREALGFGLRWGLGHSGAVLALGLVVVALDLRLSDPLARGLEFGVGTLLLGLGLWLLWSLAHDRAHAVAAGEEGAAPHAHAHGGGSLWVGVAHGLAGTAGLVAVLQVSQVRSPWEAGAYLLLFGVGTTAAMALYALLAGALFQQAGRRLPRLAGTMRAATALGSAVLGVVWMFNAVGG